MNYNYGYPFANFNPIPNYNFQQNNLSGKYVNDFNEINANDVSMESPSIFIKNDLSEIQLRKWTSNGTITTTQYKAQIQENNAKVSIPLANTQNEGIGALDGLTKALNDRFDKIESMLREVSRYESNGNDDEYGE